MAAAITDLDATLTDRGVRLHVDSVDGDRAVHGVTPRSGLLTPAQREALHRLVDADVALDVDTARVLYAAAHPEIRCSERHHTISVWNDGRTTVLRRRD